jgi:NADH:ubiquinone oxidoreductase subunit E
MNFPPQGGPPLIPTHQPIDMMSLYDLFETIREMAATGPIKIADLEALADEKGVPRTHAYAATMFDPSIELETRSDVSIHVCTGRCQVFGAIDLLEELLKIRDARTKEGKKSMDVVPRSCLDQCDFPPVMVSRSAHGMCGHRFVKKEEIEEIVQSICSED